MNTLANPVLLDCTLRDGGYYNAWDFNPELIQSYLLAMEAAQVDVVELGFRFLANEGFKGPCAYTKDDFLRSLNIPESLQVSVMVNGSDLLTDLGLAPSLELLFPENGKDSPVDIVRIACHYQQLDAVLPAAEWLSERGYRVGFNLMQISARTREEITHFASLARSSPIEVLYFADSMGSLTPDQVAETIGWMREEWSGEIGIHTHDNLGLALQNTLKAYQEGATWLDGTVTGMGRGPGNARTEELSIEVADIRKEEPNLVPLMGLIRKTFSSMKEQYGWGTNPYYYLSGKHGIHPTYIQRMLRDARYHEEDILAVIDYLREEGGKKFSADTLEGARTFFHGEPSGNWSPESVLSGKDVLILGTGPGTECYREAIETYIRKEKPVVLALNTQTAISAELIKFRAACHPVRLLADAKEHLDLPQPLITPASMLPDSLKEDLKGKELLDYGLAVEPNRFEFGKTHCIAPASLVLAYVLAICTSGKAKRILMAGFDGYPPGDPRNQETAAVLETYRAFSDQELLSVTPTTHQIHTISIYGNQL